MQTNYLILLWEYILYSLSDFFNRSDGNSFWNIDSVFTHQLGTLMSKTESRQTLYRIKDSNTSRKFIRNRIRYPTDLSISLIKFFQQPNGAYTDNPPKNDRRSYREWKRTKKKEQRPDIHGCWDAEAVAAAISRRLRESEIRACWAILWPFFRVLEDGEMELSKKIGTELSESLIP